MSTTSISQDTAVINQPKSPTTGIMNQLNSLYKQNQAYAVGDDQVQHVPTSTSASTSSSSSTSSASTTASTQTGGRKKTYKVKQMGGRKKWFSIQARNMHEAAEKSFLQIGSQRAVFSLQTGGGRCKSYAGHQTKIGKRSKNIIQEL